MEKIQKALLDGKPARSVSLSEFEKEAIKQLCLLTMKPVIFVANVAESEVAEPENNPHVKEVIKKASELNSGVVTISAQVCDVLIRPFPFVFEILNGSKFTAYFIPGGDLILFTLLEITLIVISSSGPQYESRNFYDKLILEGNLGYVTLPIYERRVRSRN